MFKQLRPVVAALAAAPFVAQAAYVDIKFDNPIFTGMPAPAYDAVTITYPKALGGGSQSASVAAGRFQGTATNLVDVSPSVFVDGVDDVYMYCYDVYEQVRGGQSATYEIDFDGETARTLDFLGAVNTVLNQGKSDFDVYAWLRPTTGQMGAAIQLGIWESLYETSPDWDLGSGSFKATGIDAQTSVYLDSFLAAIGSSPSLDGRYAMVLRANGIQDMITGDPPPNDVPEPGSLALFALAGAALWRQRRRSSGV